MNNNTPDYEDNLYFACNKTQANNLACNKISLTEKWKKGELSIGWYYIKLWKGCIVIDHFIMNNQFLRYDNSDIVKVIAPIPSYEEWQAKLEENAKLKELLKECRYEINPSYIEMVGGTKTFKNLIDKINEALK